MPHLNKEKWPKKVDVFTCVVKTPNKVSAKVTPSGVEGGHALKFMAFPTLESKITFS